jgi:solute carrier family 25 (mitochondrial S-adenosylmethionine transporter), member 26
MADLSAVQESDADSRESVSPVVSVSKKMSVQASASSATTAATTCVPTVSTLAPPSFSTALLAGGFAGMTVDIALYPIDTLKTRLQAPVGFWKAGGFNGIYRGLGATATGSGPGAALFFCTYEAMKPFVLQQQEKYGYDPDQYAYISHMLAASSAEAVACLVRVPTEVVKSKMQTSTSDRALKLLPTIQAVWQERTGSRLAFLTGGLYRGYGITLFREIPFAMIQFPLYEQMKQSWAASQNVTTVNPLQAAMCGSVAGGITGAITTPLDVLKVSMEK